MLSAGALRRPGQGGARFAPAALFAAAPLALLPVLLLLLGSARIGPQTGAFTAIAVILILGVPHGALDGEIARPWLRPIFGRLWFVLFSLPYLGLAAAVLFAWRAYPSGTLAVFLAASVCHFGLEDAQSNTRPQADPQQESTGDRIVETIARGGLPVAIPVLCHPAATSHFLGIVSLTNMPHPPGWLFLASLGWCPIALYWLAGAIRRSLWTSLADAALVTTLFAALPILQAFAAYFVCLHAPRHMAAIVSEHRAPRVQTTHGAILHAAPVTALTFLIGAGLWHAFPGVPSDRLLTLTIQGLAALTLPHMMLEFATSRSTKSPQIAQPVS